MRQDKTNMSIEKIESHLKNAVDQLTPYVLERIDLSTRQEQPDKGPAGQRPRFRWNGLAAACMGILLLGGGSYAYKENKVVSIVGLDVNPSVEFSLNYRQKVLAVKALNAEAQILINNRKLKGQPFYDAVDTVVADMEQQGYFQQGDQMILLSVTPVSEKTSQKLEPDLISRVETVLSDHQIDVDVYNQRVVLTDEVEQLASQYGISHGKAYYLQELISQNDQLEMGAIEELADLRISEISEKAGGLNADISSESVYVAGETSPEIPPYRIADDHGGGEISEPDEEETEAPEKIIAKTGNDRRYTAGRRPPAPSRESDPAAATVAAESEENAAGQLTATPSEAENQENIKPSGIKEDFTVVPVPRKIFRRAKDQMEEK